MSALQVALWVPLILGAAQGSPGEGIAAWARSPHVNQSQLFAHGSFPPGFMWGAGSAALQVEDGGAWRGRSIWDGFGPEERAGDSYHLWHRDLRALEQLGVSYYQFSLSWPRLLPNGSALSVNPSGVQYYNRVIDSLLHRGLQPVVTLYHWDLPRALQERLGGWASEALPGLFQEYASFCFREFGDRVKYWITMHNPYMTAWHGYGTGLHAPGEKGEPGTMLRVAHNLIKAHARVWHDYNTNFRPTQKGFVSVALGSHWIEPEKAKATPENIYMCQKSIDMVLGWFSRPIFGDGDYPEVLKEKYHSFLPNFTEAEKKYIKGSADFFAFSFGPNNFNPSYSVPTMGQDVSLNLREALKWIKLEYDNPRVLIAENGWFTKSHVKTEDTTAMYLMKKFINEVLQAIKYEDVNVFGYTAWSLLDGFEWQFGHKIRRGLYYIDFNSKEKERIPKSTALFYKQIVRHNGFPSRDSSEKVRGRFPCDFSWGVTDSFLKAEHIPSSPQFIDSHLYVWNVTGNGLLHAIDGVKLKTRAAQCTDFVSIKKQLALLEQMKVPHYRFALNWSLILPNGDLSVINTEVLRFYKCLISEALKLNIQSMVTLYYPTMNYLGLPPHLMHLGGWLNKSTTKAFHDYANLCFEQLGNLVKFWITINEPNRVSHAYNKSSSDTYHAAHNLLIAHAMAWQTYDRHYRSHQQGKVSFSLQSDWAEAANPYFDSHVAAAERFLQFEIAWFADPVFKTGDYPESLKDYIASKNTKGLSNSVLPQLTDDEKQLVKGTADFFALNHFTTRFIIHEPKNGSRYEYDRDSHLLSDITFLNSPAGLAVVPWGMRKVLNWIKKRYGNIDIYITANGIDDKSSHDDDLRKYYLKKYTHEVLKAHQIDKINIKGYYAFRLKDTYKKAPFGFFNSELQPKSSVEAYKTLIYNNGFPSESTENPCRLAHEDTPCRICLFFTQKKPLVFFGFCLFVVFALLLTVLAIRKHKRKRRKLYHEKRFSANYIFFRKS
ncbi:beta-klotho isoform X2 [Lissotriton helveticus]